MAVFYFTSMYMIKNVQLTYYFKRKNRCLPYNWSKYYFTNEWK